MATQINLNNTTPTAPSGRQNVFWQSDASSPTNVSAYLDFTNITVPIIFKGSTSGSVAIGAAAIAGTPNQINFPITTGAAGQSLITDGNNPQQTSWGFPASPGSTSQILFYNGGVVSGISSLTFNPSNVLAGELQLIPSTATGDYTGMLVSSSFSGTTTHTYNRGLSLMSQLLGSTGALTIMTGLYTYIDGAAGSGTTTTNLVGADIHVNTGVGAQTNGIGVNITFAGNADYPYCYGVYVQPMTPYGGATCWGIYCANTGGFFGGSVTIAGATPTTSSGQIGLGTTVATSANAGSNGDVPAQVVGYLEIDIAGTKYKIPYYAV